MTPRNFDTLILWYFDILSFPIKIDTPALSDTITQLSTLWLSAITFEIESVCYNIKRLFNFLTLEVYFHDFLNQFCCLHNFLHNQHLWWSMTMPFWVAKSPQAGSGGMHGVLREIEPCWSTDEFLFSQKERDVRVFEILVSHKNYC